MTTTTLPRPPAPRARGRGQQLALNSWTVPRYYRWYTGNGIHAVAAWVPGRSGYIEALCGVPSYMWVETDRTLGRCPTCADRIVAEQIPDRVRRVLPPRK